MDPNTYSTRRACGLAHLRHAADPGAADAQARRHHERRGLWLSPTFAGMVAVAGLLDPEAGQTLLTALELLARPAAADDRRSAAQRRADALAELARRNLEAGSLPRAGGVRPQLTVTVDLAGLLGGPGSPGGPTDLANLVLVCRLHHRELHEGGSRLRRDADGRVTVTHRRRTAARAGPARDIRHVL
jgi:Domain of unknown function (DUF222)